MRIGRFEFRMALVACVVASLGVAEVARGQEQVGENADRPRPRRVAPRPLRGPGVIRTVEPASQPAAGATTSPSTRPAQSVATLRQWVAELADTDPDVRDRARSRLMGIDPADLDRLRQAVAEVRPLAPSQTAALREVVSQVYLAGEQEEPAGAGGFLGVQVALSGFEAAPAGQGNPAGDTQPIGLAVATRVPGFCGYRALEDGDVILRLTSDKTYEFRNPTDLSTVVSQQRPGDTVTLDILRRGKLIRVSVTLDRKPIWVGQFLTGDPTGPRQRRAAEYWDRTFGPLLDDGTS